MLSIKPGALITGLKPEIVVGLLVIISVFEKYGFQVTITEGTGGHHMQGSLHYKGLALDIRSKDINSDSIKNAILADCKNALGAEFDMILESVGTDNEHMHAEFDPKG